MGQFIVGVDVGGTKVAGGLLSPKARLLHSRIVPTRADRGFKASFRQILNLIDRMVSRAGGKEKVAGIGICAPGPLSPQKGLIIEAPNLPGWKNIRLARMIEKHFGLPAKVENDANAAGLAEALFGAAVGYRHVFYVTVSTGIGTGIIIDRKIYHGKNGVAGGGGHVPIGYKSPFPCGSAALGCVAALGRRPAGGGGARRRLAHGPNTPDR